MLLLALARQLADEAGSFLLEGWSRPRTGIETKSTGTDMVSEMDRGTERLIVDTIMRERPNDAILGEEGTTRSGTSGVRWIIDPLDGTTNYLYGLPMWAVSIGVEVDGVLRVGVVTNPALGEEYWAERGSGAFRNGESIAPSTQNTLGHALVATGFSYQSSRRAVQADVLSRLLPQVRDIRRAGSAATDMCWVACGRVDAYYEAGCAPWDLAAGTVIAREAGAIVTGRGQAEPDDKLCLTAAPNLHAMLDEIIGR